MITRGDKIVFGIIILLAIAAFFFLRERNEVSASPDGKKGTKEEKKDKKGKKKDKGAADAAHDPRVTIVRKWDMPAELKEISGIASIGDGRFACVQDELGKIYIYSTTSKQVERQISFGDAGDYEGIAVVDATAYVLRADGKLFEVKGYDGGKPAVVQHSTHLTAKQDVEGLCFDRKNNRLLLAIKGKEANNADYKGIYAFDLATKRLAAAPVYKVGGAGGGEGGGKKEDKIEPSDLEVHPATGDIYIVDGPSARLAILSPDGSQKEIYELSNVDFPQPEGMAFTPAGVLFISNEGKDGAGNILELAIKDGAQ